MTPADLATLGANFGSMGLLVGYLIWRDVRRDRIDKERIDADVRLAASLTLLEATIRGRAG